MLPYQMIAGGQFTVTVAGGVAAAVNVEVISQNPPDLVILKAITGWGRLNQAGPIQFWKDRSTANGNAFGLLQSSHASAPAVTTTAITSGGITTFDTANPPTFAGLATTAITGSAGTFVVSMTNTGSIAVGDYVRLYNTTGELQIAGLTFQVTAVTANTSITLGYMASSGITFAADATAGTVVKFIPNKMYPRRRYIANISQAVQAVVNFTEKNDFTVGEKVSFRVPTAWGMKEINNVTARVLAVTNSATVSSITLDLDTTGFTAFAWPTSANAKTSASPAVCVPASSGVVPISASNTNALQPPGTNLLDAFDNRNTRIIQFGAGLFNISSFAALNNDSFEWEAYKYDSYSTSTITL